MAAEARAESPAAPVVVPAAASPEKRVLSGDAGREEERPEPKRRRACVAALDSVPCAAPPLVDGDGASFSFQHARGGFVVLETTPKFGSFNPPAAAAVGPKPAPPAGAGQGSPEEEGGPAREEAEAKDGNSQLVGPGVQGQKT